jgi:hypothetical protein
MSEIAAVHNTGLAAEAGEALRRLDVGVRSQWSPWASKRSFVHEPRRRYWGLNTTLFQ